MTDVLIHAYGTDRRPPSLPSVCRAAVHHQAEDADGQRQLDKLRKYCQRPGPSSTSAIRDRIVRHSQRVRHHYSFEVHSDHFGEVTDWAWAANAILHLPDGTLRDPAGRILWGPPDESPEPNAELPFPLDARQRKLRNEQTLRNRLIGTPDELPPIVGEVEVSMRSAEEVARRALAVFAVAVRSESVLRGQPLDSAVMRQRYPLAFESASPAEMEFLNQPNPPPDVAHQNVWRYEALSALQWMLKLQSELPFPDQTCDVATVAARMLERDPEAQIQAAALRSNAEILDVADANTRMLWAASDAVRNRQTAPAGVDGCILIERQHVLDWVTRSTDADWDRIEPGML